jgi:hypothetical protein
MTLQNSHKTLSAPRARYILASHADFVADPSGRTLHYLIADKDGLIVCRFSGAPARAAAVEEAMGLQSLSWADWLALRERAA